MNLLLFSAEDRHGADLVIVQGRRHRHLAEILRAEPGTTLPVGELGGKLGLGTIRVMTDDRAELTVTLDRPPPSPLSVTLILALPRPKVLRRVLQTIATMGVKRLVLVAAAKVEKAYWQSPFLAPPAIQEQLRLGLEQAGDTILPEVELRPRFRPLVEDELPACCVGAAMAMVADPAASAAWPAITPGQAVLAIGPEGGWTGFELDLLGRAGLIPVHFGPRTLRVEQVVPALLGRWL